ncbi:MAG: hypothetical protein Q9181_000590 [Wetmoreana brouardii]
MRSASVPRFLLPRGCLVPTQVRQFWGATRNEQPKALQRRNASTTPDPSKPRVLEKPAKFYPPSHPQRLVKRTTPRQYPGPRLSEAQKEVQKTKKYPHMMPAEGTFMFWFLNSRMLHTCITLGVLLSLAIFVYIENFHRTTPFADMLPSAEEFWVHPFRFVATYGQVYKLHTDHVSAETAERRKKKVDDVQKRSRYRKAHGLEKEQGFGGWTAKTDAELLGPAMPTGDSPDHKDTPASQENSPIDSEYQKGEAPMSTRNDPSDYINVEAKRPPVKRWLGIWS